MHGAAISRAIAQLIVILILIETVNGIAIASSLGQDSPQSAEEHATTTNPDRCGFEGNSDIYGLGIRLGIYAQWISAFITFLTRDTESRSERISDLVDIDAIFETAIFIATMVLISNTSSAHSAEIIVLCLIFFGDFYLVQVSAAISHPGLCGMFSALGIFLRVSLAVAMSSYTVWFWFVGLDKFQQSPCGSYVFLFRKARITGSARKFFKALSCVHVIVWSPVWMMISFWALILFMLSLIAFANADRTPKTTTELSRMERLVSLWLGSMVPWNKARERGVHKGRRLPLLFVLPALITLTIIAIELTLAWNSISGVYTIRTTGQLIPFVIGVGGIWKAVNDRLSDRLKPKIEIMLRGREPQNSKSTQTAPEAKQVDGEGAKADDSMTQEKA